MLDGILRLIHPFMPFVTESIWQALGEAAFERGLPEPHPAAESVAIAPWPDYPETWRDAAMEARLRRMQDLVRMVREMRNHYLSKDPRTPLNISVRTAAEAAGDLKTLAPFVRLLANVGSIDVGPDVTKPKQSATQVHADFELYVSLAGLIDVPAEIVRLQKQLAEKQGAPAGCAASWPTPASSSGPGRRRCSASATRPPTWKRS